MYDSPGISLVKNHLAADACRARIKLKDLCFFRVRRRDLLKQIVRGPKEFKKASYALLRKSKI
jgi:hypothetical protein